LGVLVGLGVEVGTRVSVGMSVSVAVGGGGSVGTGDGAAGEQALITRIKIMRNAVLVVMCCEVLLFLTVWPYDSMDYSMLVSTYVTTLVDVWLVSSCHSYQRVEYRHLLQGE
jgi:hypothetical protein